MNQIDFFQKLSKENIDEFNNDVKNLCDKIKRENLFPGGKVGEFNTHMRLGGNKFYLNITLFISHMDGQLNGVVKGIKRLTLNQYLDSINDSKTLGENWIKVK